jgi:hypothetical protein
MKRFSRKKKFLVLGAAGAVALGSGAAYALWTASGTGPTSSLSRTAITITVAASTPTADLYPGFTGGDLAFTLRNDNPYPVTFSSMAPGTVTSGSGTCAASNVTVAPASGLTLTVAANSTSAPQVIDNVVTMSVNALDACQGVTFTVPITLTGTQS